MMAEGEVRPEGVVRPEAVPTDLGGALARMCVDVVEGMRGTVTSRASAE